MNTRGKKSTRCGGVSPSPPSLRAPTLNLCQRNCSAAQRQPLPLPLPLMLMLMLPERRRFISKMVVKEDDGEGGRDLLDEMDQRGESGLKESRM
ncbi:hypothetical protein FQA47_000462 [Oryzias melastigma]|uniref:Uncharacterized protein n=1 Tax=Oryzias melastigma TaxID=30732 RepID=A0A834FC97_ORYME|nr:hypothetical protein FQA47_000462 [Oryzias melastigma]